MLTLEPEDLPVYAKLCERQKKILFACRFMGSLSCLEIMGLFLYKKTVILWRLSTLIVVERLFSALRK